MKTDVLTVKQVSERLGIGLNQAYEACERKQIPCVRFGRRWLIPVAAFEKWLSTCGLADSQGLYTPTHADAKYCTDQDIEREETQ